MPGLTFRSLVLLLAGVLVVAASAARAEPQTVETRSGAVAVENVTDGLDHPWGMTFLPDGRMLVTERPGRLRIVSSDGSVSPPLEGTPEVFAQDQGGLLDVALDPDFASNRLVYLSFAEPSRAAASTALGRGRLADNRIEEFEVIFRQEPKIPGGKHFGSRIVFSSEGHVFLTLGERFQFDPAQDLSNHLGTIVRVNRDGSIPENWNPPMAKRPHGWSRPFIRGDALPSVGNLCSFSFVACRPSTGGTDASRQVNTGNRIGCPESTLPLAGGSDAQAAGEGALSGLTARLSQRESGLIGTKRSCFTCSGGDPLQ